MCGALGQVRAFEPLPDSEAWIVEAEKGNKTAGASQAHSVGHENSGGPGSPHPQAVANLNKLFNNGAEEESALIRRELGKYLKS